MADKVTAVAGSWGFIIVFCIFLILWMIINYLMIVNVDPYPFILLNLILSCIAALQAPIIMMSQNRAAKKDSLRSLNDYKTDLKSELILEVLHEQIKELQSNQKKDYKIARRKQQIKWYIKYHFFFMKILKYDIIRYERTDVMNYKINMKCELKNVSETLKDKQEELKNII